MLFIIFINFIITLMIIFENRNFSIFKSIQRKIIDINGSNYIKIISNLSKL